MNLTTSSPVSNTTLVVSAAADSCFSVESIPGIVSNDTRVGLEEFSESYRKIHGYIAVAVCLFGVLSNCANIIVLTRKNMASSTNTLLLWLAVCDLLKMTDYLLFAVHFYVMEPADPSRFAFSSSKFSWIVFLLFHANFSIVCHTTTIWLTIALAIFRYIYICKPTSGVYYCSQQRARYVVVTIIVLTIFICIPNYTANTYGIQQGETTTNLTEVDSTGNITVVSRTVAYVYYHPLPKTDTELERVIHQVNHWLQAILIKLVPCFMLTTLTLLLVHAMHKAYRKRLKLKSQGRKAESDKHGEHNRITRMLLAVVILFTLTELPQGILTLMNIFVECFVTVVYDKLGDLLDIMALTNNSVTFILYCTMSTQFRTTFAAIFCPQQEVQPKWLKLRITKSRQGSKQQSGVSDGNSMRSRGNNGFIPNETTATDVETNTTSGHDNHHNNVDAVIDTEKVPLDANNGVSTHTHGYSPDHSHV